MPSSSSGKSLPLGALAFALLAGCADHPHHPRGPDPEVMQFAGRGYLSEEQYSINTQPVSWTIAGREVDFMLSVPARPGRYPLIIYLPGLGEGRNGGEAWRTAWARAGYAVLSVQLLAEDARAWQSREARGGDFKPLVKERYSPAAMASRQSALHALIEALGQHASDPLLMNVDAGHIVLAGYDIGAYTAMVAAGERFENSAPPAPALPLAAVVALSPYADFSGPGFATRYASITAPVLSVSGEGDTDSYGWVGSAALRTAPFEHMPPDRKYLLMLADTSHELLGGNAAAENRGDRATDGKDGQAQHGERRQGRRHGGSDGEWAGGRPGRGEAGADRQPLAGAWGYGQSAVRSVSTAYLDAVVRNDPIAQEWLRRDARRWLRDTATLTVK